MLLSFLDFLKEPSDMFRRNREKHQCAQSGPGWNFNPHDPFLDVLTCGVCGGTSLWRFEIGMIFIKELDPPSENWLSERWNKT